MCHRTVSFSGIRAGGTVDCKMAKISGGNTETRNEPEEEDSGSEGDSSSLNSRGISGNRTDYHGTCIRAKSIQKNQHQGSLITKLRRKLACWPHSTKEELLD